VSAPGLTVCFTVDYEPDCPPWMTSTFRGVEEATAPLLAMLGEEGVRGTFFSTGVVAERYPDATRAIVAAGHELGCHGHTHTRFTELGPAAARDEIGTSAAILRRHAAVTSFRAPNLVFPEPYVALLADAGFTLDSSEAKYKAAYWRARRRNAPAGDGRGRRSPDARRMMEVGGGAPQGSRIVRRVPASATSSVLRLPRPLREAYLARLASPVVLFVHPWEFVDLRHTTLRWDCRAATGETAMRRVRASLRFLARRGARFVPMGELPPAA
jgi:peptidoglycan-N-acetylglucosamine deacetylase